MTNKGTRQDTGKHNNINKWGHNQKPRKPKLNRGKEQEKTVTYNNHDVTLPPESWRADDGQDTCGVGRGRSYGGAD